MSFAEGLNECLRSSIPVSFLALTFLSVSLAGAGQKTMQETKPWFFDRSGNSTNPFNYANHELLLGSEDAFFWFLIPLFGLLSVGICVLVNYIAMVLTYFLALLYTAARSSRWISDGRYGAYSSPRKPSLTTARIMPAGFSISSTRRRVITVGILLSLVSTVIPYHFVYMVLCIVQLSTCVRGYKLARDSVRHLGHVY